MNLVEELRKVASPNNHGCVMCDTAYAFGVDESGGCDTCADTMNKIADLIEKYYYPKQNPMAENNKCNAVQYDEIVKHISALLWLNDNGGWEAVSKRLMPEGYEWPYFSDGTPVTFDDMWEYNGGTQPVLGIAFRPSGEAALMAHAAIEWKSTGESFNRYQPKVLDADGVPIKVGDILWYADVQIEVAKIIDSSDYCVRSSNGFYYKPKYLTHEKPVFDADGERIKVGHTVHVTGNDVPFTVTDVYPYGVVRIKDSDNYDTTVSASLITHKKPVKGADGKLIKSGEIVYGLSDGKEWRVTKVTSGSHPVEAVSDDSVRQLKASWLTHEKVDTQEAINDEVSSEATSLAYLIYNNDYNAYEKWIRQDKVIELLERQRALCKANKCV